MSLLEISEVLKGGRGSGNFGHSGRPGQIGGSGSLIADIPIFPKRGEGNRSIAVAEAARFGQLEVDTRFVGVKARMRGRSIFDSEHEFESPGPPIREMSKSSKGATSKKLDKAFDEAGIRDSGVAFGKEWGPGGNMLKAWSTSSNNDGGPQDVLQRRARQEHGGVKTKGMGRIDKFMKPNEIAQSELTYDLISADTRKILKRRKIDLDEEITVYRGFSSKVKDVFPKPGETVSLDHRPLSSWTADPAVAQQFSDLWGKGGVVVATKIKARGIFAMGGQGFGNVDESELILFADALGELKVMSHDDF